MTTTHSTTTSHSHSSTRTARGRPYVVASGPGLFGPTHGTGHADAGHGLGRRAAGVALEESLRVALSRPWTTTPTGHAGVVVTTRELVDAVLGLLPSARRDTEFALGVHR